ncbi:MAG: hypothetical protein QOJ72_1614 [Nocardioidaceae bacterium]|nr:hypothetical protein [Nocardioidaceae bacterium]
MCLRSTEMGFTVLIERDELVGSLRELAGTAMSGSGRLVMLGGEAGVGKTSVAAELMSGLPSGLKIRRGASDNVTTPAPLGPLLEALPELGELIGKTSAQRHELFREAQELLAAEPTVLLIEDAHWADEATFDLLRLLGRRVDSMALLVVVTYRTDEVDTLHPLSMVFGDLATAPGVIRREVPALTVDGVRRLVEIADSPIDAVELHARTGGNPFFATEVIAGATDELPTTIRDAVLARTSRLSPGAQGVLSTLAVLGHRGDLNLLVTIGEGTVADVDECVRSGMVVADGTTLSFRHELARLAVEDRLTLATRIDLNARVLAELEHLGSEDYRRLAHYAVASGNRDAVIRYAPRAAALAASLGAHRESAQQCRTALSWLEPGSPERAAVLEQLSFELHLMDMNEDALIVQQEVLDLHRRSDDAIAIGRSLRWMSRLHWMVGGNAKSRRFAKMAVDTLEAVEPGHELAMAYSNLAQLGMAADDIPTTQHWAELAMDVAAELDDRDVRIHALNNLGSALMMSDEHQRGFEMLCESLELALEDDAEAHAARAYSNLGAASMVNRRYDVAEGIMAEGIAYCIDRNLDYCHFYMSGWLARSMSERGDFAGAAAHAAAVLDSPYASATSKIPALAAAGQIAAWLGKDPEAELAEALELASTTGEPQRLIPVAVARADASWISGQGDIVAEIDRVWDLNASAPHPWKTGELAWWLHVAGVERPLPGPIAEPYALMLAGDHRGAAEAWRIIGSPFWAARALSRSDDPDDAREAWKILDELGAAGVLQAMLRDRRSRGQSVPRGPRASSSDNTAGLTVREHEVLLLLAEGMTNAEIAERLFLSTKTVGHHVSAVLRKLEAPTRTRAAAVAAELGLTAGAQDA